MLVSIVWLPVPLVTRVQTAICIGGPPWYNNQSLLNLKSVPFETNGNVSQKVSQTAIDTTIPHWSVRILVMFWFCHSKQCLSMFMQSTKSQKHTFWERRKGLTGIAILATVCCYFSLVSWYVCELPSPAPPTNPDWVVFQERCWRACIDTALLMVVLMMQKRPE